MTSPQPQHVARLRPLNTLQMLDTPRDALLDGMVRATATMTDCPMAVVSLVTDRSHRFMSRVGVDLVEVPRESSFCEHAIAQDDIFEVPDCTRDLRFVANPLVRGAPHIAFYAGVPIEIDGCKVGTLCILDQQPRRLTTVQRAALKDLALAVQRWFEEWQRKQSGSEAAIGNALFEHLSEGALLLDPAQRLRRANAQASAMLGLSAGSLVGRSIEALLSPCEHARLLDRFAPPTGRQVSHPFECHLMRDDGSRFLAEVTARPVEGLGHLAVIRDITDARARELLMRQQALAIDQGFAGVMIYDLDFNFVYANKAALEMSGYGSTELIGRNVDLLRLASVPPAAYDEIRALLRKGRSWSGLLYCQRKDRSEFVQLATISPIAMGDEPATHFLWVGEDVTEKRRMSKELEDYRNHLEDLVEQRTAELALAKRAAESASRAKSDFLASMSHEIRTPMNGVLGIVEVLRASPLTTDQIELTDTIKDSGLALLEIIDEVLDFSKIEAGHLQLEREPLQLQRVAESVCDALLPVASNRGVGLRVFVDPGLPAWIVSDAMRLRQLLNNLLGNAIKFSSGGNRTGRVWLSVDADDEGALRIVVGDNGIGMAPEVQKRIFEPFVQAEGSTTRRFGGTGLGLSICKRVAESFGGRLEVRSVPGRGAIFTLTLPLEPVDRPADVPDPAQLTGLHCHVYLRDADQADDWRAYLVAAGATVRVWRRCPVLEPLLSGRQGGVLIIDAEGDNAAIAQLEAAVVREGVPVVRVRAGTQRGNQPIGHGIVSLEAGAVRRSTLIEAVAIAAGRQPSIQAPLASSKLGTGAADAPAPGRMILVAEDNDINRKVIERQLALLGVAADLAADGAEALERWRNGRYALLLTDLHMPNVDGYRLTETIRLEEAAGRSVDQSARLPIVALTANALRGEAERCLALGMDEYLTKPVPLERLGQTLARWLPPGAPVATIEAPVEARPEVLSITAPVAEVWLVDDESFHLELMRQQLLALDAGPIVSYRSGSAVLGALAGRDTSALLLVVDLNMPGMDGVELMRHLADRDYAGAIALVSGSESRLLETGSKLASAYKLNVLGHLHKPVSPTAYRDLIERWRALIPSRAQRVSKTYGAAELRSAIASDQLILHYQPKVSLKDGTLVGVEALVRWQHPSDGVIYPDDFIPVAEAHGLIDDLTLVVLDKAVAQASRWRELELELRMAVNVSMHNLSHLDFPDRVLEVVKRHRMTPGDLILEVTESTLMVDARTPLNILTRLRLRKVGLSIDDFGTGHSSLTQLRDIPFNELKIDRGFVRGISTQPTQQAIFVASMQMAHQLEMSVVAEGVEDRADWDFVHASGCDTAQGYFISRPLAPAALLAWAETWRRQAAEHGAV